MARRPAGVDNYTRGCLGSTVTDRLRGSEPEFAGLRQQTANAISAKNNYALAA
jgi:hypothetical protein